ncbi:signal transduction histidine kinase/phage shock protein PspC (stress-responsive transcriptional regulator) [Sinomonas atrocyanea]|uniref:ATP-binding protein n=1 Tax=Sinomonas atrocyanea TaxID=37927 RepID=UPI002786745B|nr:ATP-binding protein [Sinomonas atrocyanea]MDP9884746.1 signal transduction histidine kinase/phage shock protein PspC (stress-responsive transcriptional regulator) [Sinomonas atrocyanea]
MNAVPVRPPLVRGEDRLIAGVCSGLARHLGMRTDVVRWIMAGAAILGGAGIVLYGWLWVMVPTAAEAERRAARRPASPIAPAVSEPVLAPAAPRPAPHVPRYAREVLLGIVLLLGAVALGGSLIGVQVPLDTIVPVAAILGGAALAWMQLDEARRERLVRGAGTERWTGWLRLGAGIALVVAGVTLAVSGSQWNVLGMALLASFAVLAGVALVLLPWGVKFWRELGAERAARVREEERAEIAAHLHDSVLQTLALIQRRAGSEADVIRLARAQERELREWLYRDSRSGEGTFADRIAALAGEVEDLHGVPIEVVTVGEPEATRTGGTAARDRQDALLQAAREAMLNAVRHGAGPVSVYAETGRDATEVFVKDRGDGFDPDAVPEDRLGVRESIVGRMRRHGGEATIVSGPDGTEVRLRLPRTEET